MKYIITILLFLPLAAMAQILLVGASSGRLNGDTQNIAIGGDHGYIMTIRPNTPIGPNIADSLHKYTDSFMFYRCQVHCKEPKAGGFYLNKREKYRELAQHYYNLFDAKRTKTKVRFRSPDHYFACPCQPPDAILQQYRDSIDYYREEWEYSGRQNQVYYKQMLYFSRKFRDRFDAKAKKP